MKKHNRKNRQLIALRNLYRNAQAPGDADKLLKTQFCIERLEAKGVKI